MLSASWLHIIRGLNLPEKKQPAARPQAPAISGGLRRYLYLTAATTGAAIMVIEILGAKMLSPYLGMSHFVWTAQIAVTLVALACGYYIGGRLADRSQNLTLLYGAILAAAGYLAVIVLICPKVAMKCVDLDLALGSLLASALLFFVPLALLAMTAPFLSRAITSSVGDVGGNVGRLTAIGTFGSFLGTIGIGYVMLPLLPNSVSMIITAALLTLICVGYFLFFNRRSAAAIVVGVCLLGTELLIGRGSTGHKYKIAAERFAGNSLFGELRVLDHPSGTLRLFSNDFLNQGAYDPMHKQSRLTFTYLLGGLARAYTTNIQDVLCIGLGAGLVPMELARNGAQVEVVEINPAIEPLAVRFFDMDPAKVRIFTDDGRRFLNRCQKQYDVVVLDAFLGDASPSHLMTREAFAGMKRVLRPGGVVVINTFCQLDRDRDFLCASLTKTLKAVFASVKMHHNADQNYYVATDRENIGFVREPKLDDVHPAIKADVQAAYLTVAESDPNHGRVLTDDFNPAEFYDAKNREVLRRRFAQEAREW